MSNDTYYCKEHDQPEYSCPYCKDSIIESPQQENAELRKELEAVKSELADVRRNVGSYINDQKWLEE